MHSKYPENENHAMERRFTGHRAGFVFSILLTAVPFILVYGRLLSRNLILAGICAAGIIQILVQLHYFLGVGGSKKEQWNLITLIFTVLIMAIFIGGTLWVMFTLNSRMM